MTGFLFQSKLPWLVLEILLLANATSPNLQSVILCLCTFSFVIFGGVWLSNVQMF